MRRDIPNNKSVIVIYGRDQRARDSLFTFLRALKLDPLEWEELVKKTGEGSPFIGNVIKAGFDQAQAAVVLFTPDDEARLRKELCSKDNGPEETQLSGQARQNVLIEAGMALALYPDRTILVQLGRIRSASDLSGRHVIKLEDNAKSRNKLVERLKTAGCSICRTGEDWLKAGDFKEIASSLPPRKSLASKGSVCVDFSYFVVIRFAKLIHHEFHELYNQGWYDIGVAARSLFRRASEGNKPLLIETCEDRWEHSKDARLNVEEHVVNDLQKHIKEVDEAIKTLVKNVGKESSYIASSGSFDQIKISLKEYSHQMCAVSNYFDQQNGSLLDADRFAREAIAVNRTIDRLISKADAMIKNLIGALEDDFNFGESGENND